jgi:dCTP deaminase
MILSRSTIAQYVKSGRISVRPTFDEKQLRPFGMRVHLGGDVLVPQDGAIVDLAHPTSDRGLYRHVDIRAQGLALQPRDFVLASTVEALRVDPAICCRLDGRSTLARLGIAVHCCSETIDNNHADYRTIVLELTNLGRFVVQLPALHPIGMVMFETTSEPVDPTEEQDQYAGQMNVVGPNLEFRAPMYFVSYLPGS